MDVKMKGGGEVPMQFQASCPECKDTVTTVTTLDGSNLDRALANDGDVEVACFLGDHKWKLNAQDKANLRKLRTPTCIYCKKEINTDLEFEFNDSKSEYSHISCSKKRVRYNQGTGLRLDDLDNLG
jgi:hypothetical protein